MEPLSLAASITAVLQLARSVGTGLDKLYRLRKAPEEVLALLNEISDFRAVLLNLQDILNGLQADHTPHDRWRENLETSSSQLTNYIERANDLLLKFEKLIEYRIVVSSGADGGKPSINTLRWARARRDMKTFQSEINDIKGKILMILSTLATSQIPQVRLGLYDVQAMVSHIQDRQRELNSFNMNMFRDIRRAVVQRTVPLREHEQALLHDSAHVAAINLNSHEPTPQGTTTPTAAHGHQAQTTHEGKKQSTTSSSYTNLNVLQISTTYTSGHACNVRCGCMCHKHGDFRTPSFLQGVVGSLFVGYVGGLVQTTKCDEPKCLRAHRRSTRITYYFPMWFISRAITVSISGPQVSLTALRIRNRNDLVFVFAKDDDDWNLLADMFDHRLASPLDIDQDGWSILHWAVDHNATKTCKALLAMGADPDIKTDSVLTARDFALRKYLGGHSIEEDDTYKAFGLGSCIEELQLSRLHRILLGLVPGDLELELEFPLSPINTRDSKGSTALWWAAYSGNSALVRLLLKHDADPNIADVMRDTPMHNVYLLSYECLVDLLDHGADPSVTNFWGITPLHNIAGFSRDPHFIHPLVFKGASVNMQTVNGWTPLHFSICHGDDPMVTCLLGYGAKLNAQNVPGETPIFYAIEKNSHKCLVALLTAGADCSIISKEDDSILHFAAAFGDEDTLRILTSFKISGIDCDLRDKLRLTPREYFWTVRGDSPSQGIVDAFEELLTTIEEQNLKAAPTNSTACSEPQDNNHANTSGDATATSAPPIPGAWNFSE